MPRTGRPPKLNDIVAQRPILDDHKQPTGQFAPMTRLDQIVADIRVGMNAERACARAGIDAETLKHKERQACELRKAVLDAGDVGYELTDLEGDLLDFSAALHDAELEWQLRSEMLLEQHSQGGVEITETTVVLKNGKPTETRTKTTTTLPDPKLITWRLKHRFPELYQERVQITGVDDGPVKVDLGARADAIADALEEVIRQRSDVESDVE